MAQLIARGLSRLLPRTLFGRLALLLFVVVLASHVLALTLMLSCARHMGLVGRRRAHRLFCIRA